MQMESGHYPASPIALRMAVAIGIGMLVGMEREWSNKDVGVRSFAIVALLGMLASVLSSNIVIASLIGVLLLVAAMNTRSILTDRSLEITTSAALIVNYLGRSGWFRSHFHSRGSSDCDDDAAGLENRHCHRDRRCSDRPHFPVLRNVDSPVRADGWRDHVCSGVVTSSISNRLFQDLPGMIGHPFSIDGVPVGFDDDISFRLWRCRDHAKFFARECLDKGPSTRIVAIPFINVAICLHIKNKARASA